MANMEEFVFSVDAEVSRAVAKLDHVRKLMDTITRLRNKGVDDYRTTNQKDMYKNMRSMKDLTYQYREMNKDLEGLQQKLRDTAESMTIPDGATDKQKADIDQLKGAMEAYANDIVRQQMDIRSAYQETLLKFKEMAKFQQNYSKNFKHLFSSNDVYNLPNKPEDWERARKVMQSMATDIDGVSSKLDNVVGKIKEVNKLDRRAESMSRRAHASQYMSHQQAASFRQDYKTVSGDYVQQREKNLDTLTKMGQERTRLHESLKEIENNPTATEADHDRKILIQQTIESMDKEMEARMELNRSLERTIANMKKFNQDVQGIEVKPERGTFHGMMYERAPAIGLAFGGAFAGALGGLYHAGASYSKGMRDDEITIGQRTDTAGEEWRRGIRDGALHAGLKDKMGFTGQEMLTFQNNYLSNNGFNGMDDLNTAMQNQAVFSRVSGVNSADTTQLFSTLFKSGAVNGSQVKDIQNAFIGAIKMSGMEGREKEQLKALDNLVAGVSRGRTMTNQDVMNTLGLQSILANSGIRSLQGEQGGELLSGLNDGIREGFNDPMVRLVFGQGTEYQGVAGRFALRKQMGKGISDVSNVERIAKFAESQGGGNKDAENEVFATFVRDKLGVQISAGQAEGLMEMHRQNKLTQENIDKVVGDTTANGKDVSKKRLEEYQNSSAAIDNQSDAVTQRMATEIYDLGQPLRKLNTSMNALHPAIYGLTVAMGALAAAMLGTGAMFLMSRGVRTFAAGTMTQNGPVRGMFGRFGNMFRRGGGGGGTPTGGSGIPPVTPIGGGGRGGSNTRTYNNPGGWRGTVSGWFDPNARAGGLPNGGPSTPRGGQGGNWFTRMFQGGTATTATATEAVAGGAGGGFLAGAGKLAKGAGKILSKAALPLAVGLGIMDIMNAPKDKKGEATGSAAGGIFGGIFGGMAAGAAAGSIVPGAGTLVGAGIGLIGGIGGALLGSHFGGKAGSWFDPTEAKAAELSSEDIKKAEEKSSKANSTKEQTDKENTNTKHRTETKKTDNLAYERENLSIYSKLLDRTEQLLSQARMQNGVFGFSGNVGTGQGTGGQVQANPLDGNSNPEKIWNFFAGKGMSPSAIAGILGNLKQENSTFDPTDPNGGIAQWAGSRRKELHAYAKQNGMDPNSLDTQLNFMWKEMESGNYIDVNKMNGMSARDAAKYFSDKYEKPGKPMLNNRMDYADSYYNQYGTGTQWSNTGSKKSSTSSNNVKVSSNITITVKGDEKVSEKIKDNKDLKLTGQHINNMIYGPINYYSKEMRLT